MEWCVCLNFVRLFKVIFGKGCKMYFLNFLNLRDIVVYIDLMYGGLKLIIKRLSVDSVYF